METATSQDIKYAPGTSALRNVGDAGEVMDITETTDENENAPDEYPGDYGTMGNYYDPEHHDIWGDSEDERYQKAPRASVNADSMNPKQVAQSVMYNSVPNNSQAAPPVIESNYSDPLIKDTCGSASYHAADARRSDGLRPERGWMGCNRLPEDAPPRARFVPRPNTPQTAVRSTAPRHDNDNQQPDTTDMTENNVTAVRSLAPRPSHATVRANGTPWRPQPLCTLGLMIHIILLLLHNGDGGVEPCSPPANTTNLTTCQNTVTHHGTANGGAERCSPPTTPIPTVRSPAPRPRHCPDHTVNAMCNSTKDSHQQLGIHLVLNITPLPLHVPQRSRNRNCRNTAFSHRSTPPSQPHPAWHCRSVIVSGAGTPVCLPATRSVMGIKHALHHLTPHLPPPHHKRLFYQGQPLGDNDPTPTATAHGPIHLTL